ncbi:LysE family translocator [Lacibacterium aquatile]|uniref:LysE family translocator n=1 Tax=Lacibacterium aquatile TaxID=1168082 RepID=A0ABW5DRH8_9PROT
MSWHTFLLFLGLTSATSLMPGPNAMMTMAQGIAHGSRGAFWTVMGSFAALGAMMVASAVGAGAILMASELAFEIVKWAGVAYLAYLGVKSWRAPPVRIDTQASEDVMSIRAMFLKGFFCSAGNPKAFLFWGALFPPFLNPNAPLLPQVAILGAAAFVVEFFVMMGYGMGAAGIAHYLARKGNTTLFNKISGGTMIGAAALLATVRR